MHLESIERVVNKLRGTLENFPRLHSEERLEFSGRMREVEDAVNLSEKQLKQMLEVCEEENFHLKYNTEGGEIIYKNMNYPGGSQLIS